MDISPKIGLSRDALIVGYYVADDQDITKETNKSKKFDSLDAAEIRAAELNSIWNLKPNEKFVGMIV